MTASEMFAEVSPALAERVVEEVHNTDKDLYRVLLAATAQAKKVRPVFLERQPRSERHRTMAAALGRQDMNVVAGNVLSGWLVKNQKSMLTDFLTVLHIPHQDGVVENLPEKVDDKELQGAVEMLLGKYEPQIVGLYLRAFHHMNEANWPALSQILAEDVRLMLGE